jgi:hypothetical protein
MAKFIFDINVIKRDIPLVKLSFLLGQWANQ